MDGLPENDPRRHFDVEMEEAVGQDYPWRTMPPEEYAARYAHGVGCFSLHRYRYRNPQIGAWVRRFAELLRDPAQLEECRRCYLTPEEYARVQQTIADTREGGL